METIVKDPPPVVPLNSFLEYKAACRVQNELESKLAAFGYLSENDDELFQQLKARTGKYSSDRWREKHPKNAK